jgi:hypothetical protein
MRMRILSCVGVALSATLFTSCAEQQITNLRAPTRGALLWETVCDPTRDAACASGRMTGGGASINVGGAKITKGLELHCDITLSNNLEVNWKDEHGSHQFHITKPIDFAECADDPDVHPEPPVAPFDTFVGSTLGSYDGVDGARCSFIFVDSGEGGGKEDLAEILIWDKDGNFVLELKLMPISGGNLQAHYDQPHGNKPAKP